MVPSMTTGRAISLLEFLWSLGSFSLSNKKFVSFEAVIFFVVVESFFTELLLCPPLFLPVLPKI